MSTPGSVKKTLTVALFAPQFTAEDMKDAVTVAATLLTKTLRGVGSIQECAVLINQIDGDVISLWAPRQLVGRAS